MAKKICKCGKEMKQNTMTNYIPNCGNVSNTVIYCEAFYKDAIECFEKNKCWDCGDYYGCAAVRARHTPSELTGPRW
jgi:hypothetical protein